MKTTAHFSTVWETAWEKITIKKNKMNIIEEDSDLQLTFGINLIIYVVNLNKINLKIQNKKTG